MLTYVLFRLVNVARSVPPATLTVNPVEFAVAVRPTFFEVDVVPAIPNTNAAMTAARMTVIATIRITPITGDTASSVITVLTGGNAPLTK